MWTLHREYINPAVPALYHDLFGQVCGVVAFMDDPHKPIPVKNLINILGRRLQITGFDVGMLASKYRDEFYEVVPKMIASGKLKYSEDIKTSLEELPQALYQVIAGKNKAKVAISLE